MSSGASWFYLCDEPELVDLANEFVDWYKGTYPALKDMDVSYGPIGKKRSRGACLVDANGDSYVRVDLGPTYKKNLDDVVSVIVSLAHECRHAVQFHYFMQDPTDVLGQSMAIDKLASLDNEQYYKDYHNYQTHEADAVADSYLVARDFFNVKMRSGHPLMQKLMFTPAKVEDSMLERINLDVEYVPACRYGMNPDGTPKTHYNLVDDFVIDAIDRMNSLVVNPPWIDLTSDRYAGDDVAKYRRWFGSDSLLVSLFDNGSGYDQRLVMAAVRAYVFPTSAELRQCLDSVSWDCELEDGSVINVRDEVEHHPRFSRFRRMANSAILFFGKPEEIAAEIGANEDDVEQDDAVSRDMEM